MEATVNHKHEYANKVVQGLRDKTRDEAGILFIFSMPDVLKDRDSKCSEDTIAHSIARLGSYADRIRLIDLGQEYLNLENRSGITVRDYIEIYGSAQEMKRLASIPEEKERLLRTKTLAIRNEQ